VLLSRRQPGRAGEREAAAQSIDGAHRIEVGITLVEV
jgi:hypothetical protein